MVTLQRPLRALRGGLPALVAALTILGGLAQSARAQTPQGATLTVVSGTSAVVQANGGASQPAPSGLTLVVGDRVATLKGSTALVTFFEGSELEIGADSTIIIRELTARGTEVHVTIEDVYGTAIGRVTSIVNPNSTFSLQNPGGSVVALIRGSKATMSVFPNGAVIVGTEDCHLPCEIRVDGAAVSDGPGSVSIDQNHGVTQGSHDSVDQSTPSSSGDSNGSHTGETPADDGDEGGNYGYRGNDVTTGQLLLERAGAQLAKLTSARFSLLFGLLGWGVLS
jgi:hypothetical protein